MSATQIFPSLNSISSPFKGILLDAYGVFWNGNSLGLFTGAREALETLVLKGKVVGILSNSTQRAANEIEKYRAHGLIEGTHFHFLLTSGELAHQIFKNEQLPFKTPRKKFLLSSHPHPKYSSPLHLFHETDYNETKDSAEADFIYISIPHINGADQTDPEVFREEIQQLFNTRLPMVCANPDQFAYEGSPAKLVVRQGSIASLYKEMGGQVFYIGKPTEEAFSAAMAYFYKKNIVSLSDILMVGDTPETDIRGASRFGISSALITQTGIMADRIQHYGFETLVRTSLKKDLPTFYIERLSHDLI